MNYAAREAEKHFDHLAVLEDIRDEAIFKAENGDYKLTDSMIDDIVGVAEIEDFRAVIEALMSGEKVDMSRYSDWKAKAQEIIESHLEKQLTEDAA